MKPRIMHPPAGGETWFEEGCFITELCNSPGDPALSIARVRVAPGTETEWHSLAVDERYLIVEGGGIVDPASAPERPAEGL